MRVDVKVFATPATRIDLKALIPVFHGFIQRAVVADELLIDVADYSHVPDGPGVMLIAHQGLYGYDLVKNKPGVLYSLRRAEVEDAAGPSMRYALAHALRFGALLEQEETLKGKLELDAGQLLVRFNDRLRAPNDAATAGALLPEVRRALEPVLGSGLVIEAAPAGEELLSFSVRAAGKLRAADVAAKL